MGLRDWLRRRRDAPAPSGLPEDGSPLLATTALDGERLLREWRWLVDATQTPVLCTALGDLFLQRPGGAVFFLDAATGALRSAARSAEALDEEARDPARFEGWFKPTLCDEARALHGPLPPGCCYGWRTPPARGGAFAATNLAPVALEAHFDALGRLFRH